MKISELLEKLGELQGKHGDCEVQIYNNALGSSYDIVDVDWQDAMNQSDWVKVVSIDI